MNDDFVGKLKLKKFYTFLLSTQLYQKGSRARFQFQKLEIEFFSPFIIILKSFVPFFRIAKSYLDCFD